jgi:hypothetical protein
MIPEKPANLNETGIDLEHSMKDDENMAYAYITFRK